MKTIALITGLTIAFAAPAFGQGAPEYQAVADQDIADTPATDNTLSATGHSTTVYHGPHHYPMYTHGRAGDPAIIDHRCDTLIVEPTHSTITVIAEAVPAQQ